MVLLSRQKCGDPMGDWRWSTAIDTHVSNARIHYSQLFTNDHCATVSLTLIFWYWQNIMVLFLSMLKCRCQRNGEKMIVHEWLALINTLVWNMRIYYDWLLMTGHFITELSPVINLSHVQTLFSDHAKSLNNMSYTYISHPHLFYRYLIYWLHTYYFILYHSSANETEIFGALSLEIFFQVQYSQN